MANPILVTGARPRRGGGRTVTELLLKQGPRRYGRWCETEDERRASIARSGWEVVVGNLLDLDSCIG